MIFHATNDVVILKERRFTGPGNVRLENWMVRIICHSMEPICYHMTFVKELVKTYEQVMNNMSDVKRPREFSY